MERRRRALLGSKMPGSTPEKNVKSSRQTSTFGESSKSNSEDKNITKGKALQKGQPTGSVTPKQKTTITHSNVTPLKPQSPCSPLQSPSCQMIFPGTLASPEIEVSWDWSCSQVPKDMLPPKRVKRVQDVKEQLPALPTLNMCPRPRPTQQRQITEEENQQRLEYYKNILSLKPQPSDTEVSTDSLNNNLENVSSDAPKSFITPKRPTTRSLTTSKKKDEDNSLFDDSANEFMFECSQAIEEKIKNGEIDMGPIVDIKISQAKRALSPGMEIANFNKKTCHGRVNLFPVNSNSKDMCIQNNAHNEDQFNSKLQLKPFTSNNYIPKTNIVSEKTLQSFDKKVEVKFVNTSSSDTVSNQSGHKMCTNQNALNKSGEKVVSVSLNKNNPVQEPLINSNCQTLERRPLLTKPAQSVSCLSSNNHMRRSQNICADAALKKLNVTNNNRVDALFNPKSGNNTTCKNNQSSLRPQNPNSNIRNQEDVNRGKNYLTNHVKEMQKPNLTMQDKSSSTDVTSLLDDDFNLELSSLDVDSLCRSSENIQPEIKCASAPKICTQQEIEAKRLAALQKLKMKKRR